MPSLSGKTALITGASVGIGRDLAEIFAREGHRLVVTARNQVQLEELAANLRKNHGVNVEVIAADLSQADAPRQIFDQVQAKSIAIDFLVNNAGFGVYGEFGKSDPATQIAMVQVNVTALVHLTGLFLPSMLQRRSGKILNVASTAAFQPGPLLAVYYASKAFVLSFSEALDNEASGKGVSVTTLCPGPTTTEFQKRSGMDQSRLFRGKAMTSMEVAQIGYRAMMRGQRTIIAGWRNKLLIYFSRPFPRRLKTVVARKFNEGR